MGEISGVLPDEQQARLEALAVTSGRPISELVRAALEAYSPMSPRLCWKAVHTHCSQVDGWTLPTEAADPPTLAEVGSDRIVAEHQAVTRIGPDGGRLWSHACQGNPASACISGDRLLVTTFSRDYHAWGNLGPALLLDLRNGALVAMLRGERAAPLDGGSFILGLEGYGTFETWLHDRTGVLRQTWHSFGHYFPEPDGSIRVVECDRLGGESRVVRLLEDGSIQRGPQLRDDQVPPPLLLDDGTLLILDEGALRAVDRQLVDYVVSRVPGLEAATSQLKLDGNRLSVTIVDRGANAPLTYVTHEWTLVLTPPSG